MNRFVLRCLERVLGTKKEREKYHDLDMLVGSWSKQDFEEFQKAVASFEEIDSDLWK